jgi:hypothetical protein
MRRGIVRGGWPAIALIVLASVVAAAGADFLPHTDDGCQTEIHCLVCRTACSSAVPVALAAPVSVALVLAGTLPPHISAPFAEAEPGRLASRGPPSA